MSHEQELGGFSQGAANPRHLMTLLSIGCCRTEIVNSADSSTRVMIKDIRLRDVECMCCAGAREADAHAGQGDVVDNSGGLAHLGLNRVKYLARTCNESDFRNEFPETK